MPIRKDEVTLAGRIRIGMAQAGIKGAAELGRKMNVNRQTVHRWINGEGEKLTPEMLFKLADALHVNARWLAFGPPNSPIKPKSPSPEENELFEIYEQLPAKAKDAWLANGRDLIRILSPASPGNPFSTRRK